MSELFVEYGCDLRRTGPGQSDLLKEEIGAKMLDS